MEVPSVYHTQIIGRRGASINKLRDQFEVNIKFPEKTSGDEESSNVIVIQGYEKNAEAAKEAILEKVRELVSVLVLVSDGWCKELLLMRSCNVGFVFPILCQQLYGL